MDDSSRRTGPSQHDAVGIRELAFEEADGLAHSGYPATAYDRSGARDLQIADLDFQRGDNNEIPEISKHCMRHRRVQHASQKSALYDIAE